MHPCLDYKAWATPAPFAVPADFHVGTHVNRLEQPRSLVTCVEAWDPFVSMMYVVLSTNTVKSYFDSHIEPATLTDTFHYYFNN